MPGYDGTGPAGAGPMTGIGMGYCMLKLPESQDEKLTGFAGLSGRPVTGSSDFLRIETAHLYCMIRQIQSVIKNLNHRIDNFEKNHIRNFQS
jgi:hypothetical protein